MKRFRPYLFTGFIALTMLACSFSVQLSDPTATPIPPTSVPPTAVSTELPPAPQDTATPVFTPLPTIAPMPTQAELLDPQIISQPIYIESASPYYIIDGSRPQMQNAGPAGEIFNALVQRIFDDQVNSFVANLADIEEWRVENMPGMASTMHFEYSILYHERGITSILFNLDTYVAGAAHPFPYSVTLNFDLSRGRDLALADLFTPGSNYLQRIADLCKADLSTREYIDFLDGADPTLENYRNWNITPDGLQITYDPYQVAPYAAGPQTVVVSYAALSDIIHETSPLYNLTP